MNNEIVRVQNLSHQYGGTQWAIKDINFQIKQKGILGLLGSNGAGKSTTMNIICGVLNQTSGEVFINGIDLRQEPEKAKMNIGFLPQRPPLYLDLTVDEYLNHCAGLRRMPKISIKAAVEEVKEKCSIAHYSKRLLRNLSGGYQQRVGIAQAIIHNPPFVVLDEPTNGLDPNQIVGVRNLIKDIATDKAVLLSTHILSEVQVTCDRINMIDHGQMVFSGTIAEFNNQIVPDSLIVEFNNPPVIEEINNIHGVLKITPLTKFKFRITKADNTEIADSIVKLSVNKNWGLTEIVTERHSLDAIFAKLSGKELNQ